MTILLPRAGLVRPVFRALVSGFQLVGLIAYNAPLAQALPQFRGGRNAQVEGLRNGANREIRVT